MKKKVMRQLAPLPGPDTFRFFRDLGRNNRKAWMDVHRDRYRDTVVAPMRALLDRLTPFILRLDPELDVSGRSGRNFSRINRDIRFAADKTPYRPQMYLKFPRLADEGADCQLYVGLSAEAVTTGLRLYHRGRRSAIGQLVIPRAERHQDWLQRQRRRLARRYESYWYATERGQWKRHAGWPSEPGEWKKMKGWVVRQKLKPAAVSRAEFPSEVERVFRQVYPLFAFACAPDWKP